MRPTHLLSFATLATGTAALLHGEEAVADPGPQQAARADGAMVSLWSARTQLPEQGIAGLGLQPTWQAQADGSGGLTVTLSLTAAGTEGAPVPRRVAVGEVALDVGEANWLHPYQGPAGLPDPMSRIGPRLHYRPFDPQVPLSVAWQFPSLPAGPLQVRALVFTESGHAGLQQSLAVAAPPPGPLAAALPLPEFLTLARDGR